MTERDDDIVSMLREDATPGTYGHALREAAAAEIERLRAVMREIASQCHNLPRSTTADRIEQIARATLEQSANDGGKS